MAYFIVGFVVGIMVGVAATQRLAKLRADRELLLPDARVTSSLRPVGAHPDDPLPITRKAAKLGITPEDLKPSDDILTQMQRAWDLGVSLEEVEEQEAAERDALPPSFGAPMLSSLAEHRPPDTVTEAVEQLTADGYVDDLHLGGGELSCAGCGTSHPNDLVEVDRVFRFEGPSDPADEAIVLGLRCPACGARGSLVSAYGPDADPDLAQAFAYLASRAGH